MKTQNNPIQHRIDGLIEKWSIAINTPGIQIVRVHGEQDEEDMLNTLFEYMLAVDTDQEDFVMVLQEPFSTHELYGQHLLEEIEEDIYFWNTSQKPEGLPFERVDWKPDYSLGSPSNVATLLVENLNNFANYLVPDQQTKVSIVIRMHEVNTKQAYLWLSDLLKVEKAPHLVFGISDTKTNSIFDKISKDPQVYTVYPELDMDGAMEQLAALGDPTAKETPYRISLVKLMNGVKNRKPKEVSYHSKECLTIAVKELEKDPNWLSQIIAVFSILYNDQVGYKKFDRAIYFADKAVEAALLTDKILDPQLSNRLIGQTHLGRGALYGVKKEWSIALTNYQVSNEAYGACKDYLMELESLRLCGWSYEKLSASAEAEKCYIEGYGFVYKLSPDLIKGSTFPFIVQKLLTSTKRHNYISNKQMNDDLTPIWGKFWKQEIDNYGKSKRK